MWLLYLTQQGEKGVSDSAHPYPLWLQSNGPARALPTGEGPFQQSGKSHERSRFTV